MLNLFGRNIVYEPTLDPWILGVLGLGAVALSGFLYWRQKASFSLVPWIILLTLRVGGILLVLAILMRPMCEDRPEGKEKRAFGVLVDTSRSMNTYDAGDRTRLAAIREEVLRNSALWETLQEEHFLRFYQFNEEARPELLTNLLALDEAKGTATDLGGSLLSVLNLSPGEAELSGLLILSDGRDNAGITPEIPAREAYARGVPVFAVGVGTSEEVRDLALSSTTAEEFAFVGEETAVWANIYQRGFEGQTVKVDFYRDEVYVSSQQVIFTEQSNYEVLFPVLEEARGHHKFTVKVEPLVGESNPRNNEYNVYLNFIEETIRVLLVEGRPHWDTKFLVQALRTDPTLSVDSVFQLSRSKYVAISTDDPNSQDSGTIPASRFQYPSTREELFYYDVLIFGRGADPFFTKERVELLNQFLLERGGSVVFCRGRAYERPSEALARIEPVVWAEGAVHAFRYQITDEGRETPIFEFEDGAGQPVVNQLPPLISAARVQGEKSLAVVLARAEDREMFELQQRGGFREMAVLAYQRYGRGKVMTVAGNGLWRWAFLPPSLSEYDSIYDQFWGQVVRWLISGSEFLPGTDLTFRTGRKVYAPGETVRFTIALRGEFTDYDGRIEIVDPDGRTHTIYPEKDPESAGLWSASFTPTVEGEHTATLLSKHESQPVETRFSCHFSSWEDQIVAANHDLLKRVCMASGGSFLDFESLKTLPEILAEKTRTVELAPKRNDVWDTRLLLLVLAGIFSIEWLGRRRLGVSQ